MSYLIICRYCGHEEILKSLSEKKCSKCADKNLKIKEVDDDRGNIFGYPEEDE